MKFIKVTLFSGGVATAKTEDYYIPLESVRLLKKPKSSGSTYSVIVSSEVKELLPRGTGGINFSGAKEDILDL